MFYQHAVKCEPLNMEVSYSSPDMQLAFFPGSLPDETIYSRISRYHVLAGHRNCLTTYSKLFRRRPFTLGEVAPARLSVLASRIPNAPPGFVGQILRHNTLLPLVMPFLATPGADQTEHEELLTLARGFLTPRRQRGDGDMHICVDCVRADQGKFGCGYWHRSHQLPAVTSCWRHGSILLSSCPYCETKLSPRNLILTAPWRKCACGHDFSLCFGQPALQSEVDFAIYARALLDDKVRKFSSSKLEQFYHEFLSESSQSYAIRKTTRRMLLSLLLERHRESFSGLDAVAYSIGVLIRASGIPPRKRYSNLTKASRSPPKSHSE